MKTMKQAATIVRAEENQVKAYLKAGYVFCPKSEWKKTRGKVAAQEAKATTSELPANVPVHKDNSRGKDKKSKYALKQKAE